jgi:hypothetical protein
MRQPASARPMSGTSYQRFSQSNKSPFSPFFGGSLEPSTIAQNYMQITH